MKFSSTACADSRDLSACAKAFINSTGEHRDKFKSFVSVYEQVRECMQQCERRLSKIIDSSDCQYELSAAMCRVVLDQVHCIASALKDESVSDMHRMKSAAKEKLARYSIQVKSNFQAITSLCTELDTLDAKFVKIQSEARKVHALTLDMSDHPPTSRLSTIWPFNQLSLSKPLPRDKLFDKLQSIKTEREKISKESERVYSEFMSRHASAYNNLNQTVDELSSMRRRMNRKMMVELKTVTERCRMDSGHVFTTTLLPLVERIELTCPSTGDFNMRLPDLASSLNFLVGSDRPIRISSMTATTESDLIEYRAVQTYLAREEGELSVSRNERVEVLRKEASGWWLGRNSKGQEGVFPSVLVAPRPAGAPLPIQHNMSNISYRPPLRQDTMGGTWKPVTIHDERIALIQSSPEMTYIGIVHFPYFSEDICVDVNDIVQIIRANGDAHVYVENTRNQRGSVPLHVLTVKEAANKENSTVLIN